MDIILNTLLGFIIIFGLIALVLIIKLFDTVLNFKANYKNIILYTIIFILISFVVGTVVQITVW